ncbi:hypothetical protein GQ41_3022 [Arenibacter algicola]|jgi:hypothetical protein|uniref:Uncharacterized protein n=2 Tax=Arenibacter TaxID=178469 RepID=A0A221UVY7_9FLAO|nr:hypothetical protein AREALGSMS7_02023 [Arenibacter algicola]RAJ11446.1 hypothetical protein LV92_02374 [Arenibacter echinorum]GBF21335.1 hypothetical protein C21_03520 [Arenibacter sp. NBRC 103722]
MEIVTPIVKLIDNNPFISIVFCLLIALALITYKIVKKRTY